MDGCGLRGFLLRGVQGKCPSSAFFSRCQSSRCPFYEALRVLAGFWGLGWAQIRMNTHSTGIEKSPRRTARSQINADALAKRQSVIPRGFSAFASTLFYHTFPSYRCGLKT